MEGRAPFLAALTLLVAISACQSTPPVPTPPPPTATPDQAACQQLIAAVDLAKGASITALAACRFTPGGEAAAKQRLADGGTRDQLWSAVWIYGSGKPESAPLLPLLTNGDASLRVMAGTVLANLGERGGLDALVSGLADQTRLAGSDPPQPINQYAVRGLVRVVVVAGAPASAAPGASAEDPVAAWRTWLAAHSAQLVFRHDLSQWTLP